MIDHTANAGKMVSDERLQWLIASLRNPFFKPNLGELLEIGEALQLLAAKLREPPHCSSCSCAPGSWVPDANGESSKGRTADFDSANVGSSPASPATPPQTKGEHR